jgi:mannose-1-phosphate guanylyltransferase/phosphomannomutase
MKAVILAGGQGMRLRPMSLERPKPMTPLLGRPVLAHILALLRGQGIRDICVTLCCQPQSVVDYFGDGAKFGVKLTYFVEESPLGTAGSVKRCMGWLGDEDFLVVSGDCVCDLPVRQAEDFHRAHGGLATLVLYRHPAPLDYGLVCTGENGRVTEFLEKPAWGQVVTEQINTGIYVLSPAAMAYVPETGPYDFGKDLFPALLRRGEGVFGCLLEGYWRDMGDCGAYLACVRDALSGQLKLEMGLPRRGPGLWCAGQLPDRAQIVPPCWLGEGVVVRPGAKLGPYALLERGCQVGENAVVRRSVLLENSVAGENSALDGAILCPGAVVERGGSLAPGAVMGENARLGAGGRIVK